MTPQQHLRADGLILTTGALPRPYDPRSEPYRLTRALPPVPVRRDIDYFLCGEGWDWRPPVDPEGQGGAGSCAAWAAAACARTARAAALTQAGQDHRGVPRFNETWLYYHARSRRGFFGQAAGADTGSYVEDNLDLLRDAPGGVLATGEWPNVYLADAAHVPPPEVEGAERADYVLSYRPFYRRDNDGLDAAEAAALALSRGMPVAVASEWPAAWFTPVGGLVAEEAARGTGGGHAWWIWGLSFRLGLAFCGNHWTPAWTPEAPALHPHMRAGDFAVPLAVLTGDLCWSFLAVTAEPVAAPPLPAPGTSGYERALAVARDSVEQIARQARTSHWPAHRLQAAGARRVLRDLEAQR